MSNTKQKMMNQVVHFEIPVDDMESAKAFYSIFGWELTDMPDMDYVGVCTTPVDENRVPKAPGGINWGLMKRTDQVRSPVIAVEVDSVDKYINKVKVKGGELVMPKMEVPGMGYYAYVKDPEGSLRNAIESALRHVVGDNTLDQTLTVGRENIAQEVQSRLQSYLDIYQTGLIVQQVNIEKTDPPAAVKNAFDDVVAAREDKERLQNEAERYALSIVPEARGQAQARIKEAEAYKEAVVAEAEGEVERFNQLLAEYLKAPDVTRDRLYLDALQSVLSNSTKVMVDVEGGNNLLYLPLDKIMEENKKKGDDDE